MGKEYQLQVSAKGGGRPQRGQGRRPGGQVVFEGGMEESYSYDDDLISASRWNQYGVRGPAPMQAAELEALQERELLVAAEMRARAFRAPQVYVPPPPSLYEGIHLDQWGMAGRRRVQGFLYGHPAGSAPYLDPREVAARLDGGDRRGEADYTVSGFIQPDEGMSQRVLSRHPWLTLSGVGGVAQVLLTAGIPDGGSTVTRRFYVGAGFEAVNCLSGYAFVRVQVESVTPSSTRVQFSWTSGVNSNNKGDLLYPEQVSNTGTFADVPPGAYAVVSDDTAPTFQWQNPLIGTTQADVMDTGVVGGEKTPVLGTKYSIGQASSQLNLVWFIRGL